MKLGEQQKISEQHMNSLLNPMLSEGEEILCPILCAFGLSRGFFAPSSSTLYGYASCTSRGRLLVVSFGDLFNEGQARAYDISAAKKMKIGKTVLGEYRINAVFPDGETDVKLRIQAAKKVYGLAGRNFPNQERNLEKMVELLRGYVV